MGDHQVSGTLYGLGVGPGDPELVTRKAWRLIEGARVIAYPAPDTGDSFARRIVAEAIAPDAEEIPIVIPMRPERYPAQDIYDAAAAQISARLSAGADVVVLCEGDPLFYGSFMYLLARLKGHHPIEVVPGVGSIMAVASALQMPLSARNDMVTVIPATRDEADIRAALERAEAAAIMKLGRHYGKVRGILRDMGLEGRAGYVERASLPEQRVMPLSEAPDAAPYFSMILVTKGGDPWLS